MSENGRADDAHPVVMRSVSYEARRRTRSQSSLERDRIALARSEAARSRDEAADLRDREADERDAAADARDASVRTHSAAVAEARRSAARDRALARQDRVNAAADRRAAAEELASEGVDHLTGALRRRVGLAAIERELHRTARTGEPFVLAFVDVDGLKAVNDREGHPAGDALLRGVAECIRSALRVYDVVLRYGGDEFVCSLSGQPAERVRERFEQISARIATHHQGASISVGLAEAAPDVSIDQLIAMADRSMLARKRR